MTTPAGYVDLTYSFPISGLATALGGLAALQAAGVLADGTTIANEIGDAYAADGTPATTAANGNSNMAFRGKPGDPSTTPPTDPTQMYVAFRATDTQATQVAGAGIDPATYGLVVTTPQESAAVLGVWA